MDGVIYHGNRSFPHARLRRLAAQDGDSVPFSHQQQRTLAARTAREAVPHGVDIGESHVYTSAMATAAFLASQKPAARLRHRPAGTDQRALRGGLFDERCESGYVVVGETPSYTYDTIKKAVSLVLGGAKLIGTNPISRGRPRTASFRPAAR
jgi:NagD protein